MALDLFERVARRVLVATDDGSAGERGFVTLPSALMMVDDKPDVVYVCGPEAMARAVVAQAAEAGIPCQVSLERLMACGIGACLSCVVTTTAGRKRACVDGPVFDAGEVCWDGSEIPPRH
jgi:dihydroorotate dehydrogenase electron transfer subunit